MGERGSRACCTGQQENPFFCCFAGDPYRGREIYFSFTICGLLTRAGRGGTISGVRIV